MKRWPVIRHLRWFYWNWQFNRHMAFWSSLGYCVPQQRDIDHLEAIWRGEA